VPYNVSIEFIESGVLPYVHIIGLGEEEYKRAVKFMIEYNMKPSGALHLGVMLSNGITLIVSEDREYDKVEAVKRLWI